MSGRFVITGGAGFIGSHLAEALLEKGEVVVLDDLSSGRREHVPEGAEFVQGDVLDRTLLASVLHRAECVFHLAAFVSVPGSIVDPLRCHRTNSTGTLHLLLAAREAGVGKVVFASSSAIYGSSPELPKREGMLPCPESPYAVTKLTGEHYSRVFSSLHGISATSLRLFNVYGPRQDPSSPYAAVIPAFLHRLHRGEPLRVHGDGEQTRDFVYVKDAAEAFVLAMERGRGGVFNIASGEGTSVRSLAALLMELTGITVPVVHTPPRPGDVRHSCADISLAARELGFRPRRTLREGLRETAAWYAAAGSKMRP